MWSTDVQPRFQLVELFAGKGHVGQVWRHQQKVESSWRTTQSYINNNWLFPCRQNGMSVGQYDWDYSKNGMDFLSNGGFASLTQNYSIPFTAFTGSLRPIPEDCYLYGYVLNSICHSPYGSWLQQLDFDLTWDVTAKHRQSLWECASAVCAGG